MLKVAQISQSLRYLGSDNQAAIKYAGTFNVMFLFFYVFCTPPPFFYIGVTAYTHSPLPDTSLLLCFSIFSLLLLYPHLPSYLYSICSSRDMTGMCVFFYFLQKGGKRLEWGVGERGGWFICKRDTDKRRCQKKKLRIFFSFVAAKIKQKFVSRKEKRNLCVKK